MFEKYKLGAVRADVFSALEVTCLDHLAYVGAQDVDDVAQAVNLKPFQIRIIKSMIEEMAGSETVGGHMEHNLVEDSHLQLERGHWLQHRHLSQHTHPLR